MQPITDRDAEIADERVWAAYLESRVCCLCGRDCHDPECRCDEYPI